MKTVLLTLGLILAFNHSVNAGTARMLADDEIKLAAGALSQIFPGILSGNVGSLDFCNLISYNKEISEAISCEYTDKYTQKKFEVVFTKITIKKYQITDVQPYVTFEPAD